MSHGKSGIHLEKKHYGLTLKILKKNFHLTQFSKSFGEQRALFR